MQASPYLNETQISHALDISALIDGQSELVYLPSEPNYSFALDKPSENMSTLDPEKHSLLQKEKESLIN